MVMDWVEFSLAPTEKKVLYLMTGVMEQESGWWIFPHFLLLLFPIFFAILRNFHQLVYDDTLFLIHSFIYLFIVRVGTFSGNPLPEF